MKTTISVLFIVMFVMMLQIKSKGEEPLSKLSYIDQIKKTAETMEVFPVDFVARDGPLSNFRKGSPYPKISIRQELNRESFERFYDFCQLAFDATPVDIEVCVEYLPQASSKEQSLILTVFYIYVYPWEEQKQVTNMNEHIEAIKTRSWLSLQYPCDAFDLAVREKVHARKGESTEKLLKLIAKYEKSDDIAFQAVTIDRDIAKKNELDLDTNMEDTLEFMDSLGIKDGDKAAYSLILLPSRKEVVREVRQKYPESASKRISNILYVAHYQDMFDVYRSGSLPRAGNTSEKPKTVGQIAQQLLDSWKRKETDRDQTPREEAATGRKSVFR